MIIGQKLLVTAQILVPPYVIEAGALVEAADTSGTRIRIPLAPGCYVTIPLASLALRQRIKVVV